MADIPFFVITVPCTYQMNWSMAQVYTRFFILNLYTCSKLSPAWLRNLLYSAFSLQHIEFFIKLQEWWNVETIICTSDINQETKFPSYEQFNSFQWGHFLWASRINISKKLRLEVFVAFVISEYDIAAKLECEPSETDKWHKGYYQRNPGSNEINGKPEV